MRRASIGERAERTMASATAAASLPPSPFAWPLCSSLRVRRMHSPTASATCSRSLKGARAELPENWASSGPSSPSSARTISSAPRDQAEPMAFD